MMREMLYGALLAAGGLHFGLLLASFSVPRVLAWDRELEKVNRLTRQLVWVHGGFIVLTIVGLGLISLVAADELLGGSMLALAVTLFTGVFWLGRLLVQLFYFDARPWLTTVWLKVGYRGLTVLFAFFTAVYFAAAWLNLTALRGF